MERRKWTSVSLNKNQICFLDGISKTCRFTGGRKLTRTSIIRAFLRVGRKLDIDVNGVKTEKELKEKIVASLRALP